MKKKESNCQTKKIKSGHGSQNWLTGHQSQYNLNLNNLDLQNTTLGYGMIVDAPWYVLNTIIQWNL
jgi:hypothetical protein